MPRPYIEPRGQLKKRMQDRRETSLRKKRIKLAAARSRKAAFHG